MEVVRRANVFEELIREGRGAAAGGHGSLVGGWVDTMLSYWLGCWVAG